MRSLDGLAALLDDEIAFLQSVADGQALVPKRRCTQAPSHTTCGDCPSLALKLADVSMNGSNVGAKVGPRRAIDALSCELISEDHRVRWFEEARVAALIGSCSASLKSVVSGIKCFLVFAERVLAKKGPKLPPSVDELLAWSLTFRCDRTFGNYVGYLRVGCLLEGVAVDAFNDSTVSRAKRAIAKRMKFVPRKRLFIRASLIGRILEACYLEDGFEEKFAMLYLAAYVFLLRVPSEVCAARDVCQCKRIVCVYRACPLSAVSMGLLRMRRPQCFSKVDCV